MPELVGLAEIAARLTVDNRTVRRLIAQESETLGIEIQRGKGKKVLLSKDDAERLIFGHRLKRYKDNPACSRFKGKTELAHPA